MKNIKATLTLFLGLTISPFGFASQFGGDCSLAAAPGHNVSGVMVRFNSSQQTSLTSFNVFGSLRLTLDGIYYYQSPLTGTFNMTSPNSGNFYFSKGIEAVSISDSGSGSVRALDMTIPGDQAPSYFNIHVSGCQFWRNY